MRNLIRTLIVALSFAALPVMSQAELFVGVSVNLAPPALPVYVQPPCPAPGYIWMPGYWAWDDSYYWVPGTWVLAPAVGLLWTPGYWGWAEGVYVWNAGYWGPHVGFYGGINYGFGYGGVGYEGGYWRGSQFYYNRSVTNINTTNITNVYSRTVVNNVNITRVSFNGGAGGVQARPTSAQLAAQHERHLGLTPVQRQQEQSARGNSTLRAAANGGHPAIAATPRAGVFSGREVVAARGAEHAPVRETGVAHAPPRENYASAQSGQRGSALEGRPAPEHESAARTPYQGRPAPQYQPRPETPQHQSRPEAPQYQPSPPPPHQVRAEPQYQPRPEPQYQPRPEPQHPTRPQPRYQAPAPAPRNQPGAAPQGEGRALHQSQRPEHSGSPDHGGERNGHG